MLCSAVSRVGWLARMLALAAVLGWLSTVARAQVAIIPPSVMMNKQDPPRLPLTGKPPGGGSAGGG